MPDVENEMSCAEVSDMAVPVGIAPTCAAVSAASTAGMKAPNWSLLSAPMFCRPNDVICAVVSAANWPLFQALVPPVPSPATPPADSAATCETPSDATSAVARKPVCNAPRAWICVVVSATA